jgi:hypothetical protein
MIKKIYYNKIKDLIMEEIINIKDTEAIIILVIIIINNNIILKKKKMKLLNSFYYAECC